VIKIRIKWTCPICGHTKKVWASLRGEARIFADRTDFSVNADKPKSWQEFKDGRVVCDKPIEDL
jgi:hypothetical protein